METEDSLSNVNTIKEMILDEEKLVTYISISKDLCIHVNNSKSLLKVLLETIRREQPKLQLNINYLISGLIDDNKAKVSVCSEDELENIKKTFKTIFFQHIYSVGKGKPHVDPVAFVSLNKYNDFNLCSGVIKSNNCMRRSFEEISLLKSSSQETVNGQRPILSQKKNVKEPTPKAVNETHVHKIVKTEATEKETKKEGDIPQKENINKLSVNKSAAKKGIAGFFSKQNGSTKKKDTKSINVQPIIPKEEKHFNVEKMDTEDIKVEIKLEKEVKGEKGTNGNNKVLNQIKKSSKVDKTKVEADVKKEKGINGNNKVLNQIKKSSKVEKKRKRVLHVSDSESEEENDPFVRQEANENSHESDDEIPPTPAVSNLKITTGIVNPRKKRKVVDKTYMSDDGYVITKREEVYESCSDNENSVEKEPVKPEANIEKETVKREVKEEKVEISPKSKTNETKPSKKKISPPQKGKQPTLMNFFKKK